MTEFVHCPHCGSRLGRRLRGGIERPACASCGYVQFRNPVVGVAVVVVEDGRVLLGRRAQGRDRAGLWYIPCGYVEWGEEIREAARREFLEETGLDVEIGEVYAVHSNFHNPDSLTVGVWFRGRTIRGDLQAGDDLDEAGFFDLSALPGPLAFPTDEMVIEQLRGELGGVRR